MRQCEAVWVWVWVWVWVVGLVAVQGRTVVVGDVLGRSGARLVHQQTVEAAGFPLLRRTQEVYFEYPNPGVLIKGIAIRDLLDNESQPSITRGGIDFRFVNIKLESERGGDIKYAIEIYA